MLIKRLLKDNVLGIIKVEEDMIKEVLKMVEIYDLYEKLKKEVEYVVNLIKKLEYCIVFIGIYL